MTIDQIKQTIARIEAIQKERDSIQQFIKDTEERQLVLSLVNYGSFNIPVPMVIKEQVVNAFQGYLHALEVEQCELTASLERGVK